MCPACVQIATDMLEEGEATECLCHGDDEEDGEDGEEDEDAEDDFNYDSEEFRRFLARMGQRRWPRRDDYLPPAMQELLQQMVKQQGDLGRIQEQMLNEKNDPKKGRTYLKTPQILEFPKGSVEALEDLDSWLHEFDRVVCHICGDGGMVP